MGAASSIRKELFTELEMSGVEKDLLDLTKLDDDALFEIIGTAARESWSSLRSFATPPPTANLNDTTGKSSFFFRNPKITSMAPAVYFELPDDNRDAGKLVYEQLRGHLDRSICGTVTHSPRFGYKQEALRLGEQCVETITRDHPQLDGRIVKALVALSAKHQFNSCAMW